MDNQFKSARSTWTPKRMVFLGRSKRIRDYKVFIICIQGALPPQSDCRTLQCYPECLSINMKRLEIESKQIYSHTLPIPNRAA